MKIKVNIFAITGLLGFMVSCSSIKNYDKWDNEEKAMLGVGTVTRIVDWGQTLDIVYYQNNCKMKRKYLGMSSSLDSEPHPVYKEYRDKKCENDYRETNIILGKYPSRDQVNLYFATSIILNKLISDHLDHKWRKAFLMSNISVDLYITRHNSNIGLKLRF